MSGCCDAREELRELIEGLGERGHRVAAMLRADPLRSPRVGATLHSFFEADEAAQASVRRIRELYETLGRG